ncbi:MAG: glutamate 5-kinase [Solobacterium sp.]|nr:glutamate 5-kinase [Solobacterium sp.]
MENVKRIVVKIGTSTVCHANGAPNLKRIDQLCRTITDLKNSGIDVVLVSSGAIGVGINRMGLSERPKEMALRQAAASIGQGELMRIYDRFFTDYGSLCGQILLTKDITENPEGKNNVIATFEALLQLHAVPVVNENDSVATEEIVYGDNDTLSAVVALFTDADLLVILSDIDGLYDKDPSKFANAHRIRVVDDFDSIDAEISDSNTSQGTGGMITKIQAAKIAAAAGIPTILASGKNPEILYEIQEGRQPGTLFAAGKEKA